MPVWTSPRVCLPPSTTPPRPPAANPSPLRPSHRHQIPPVTHRLAGYDLCSPDHGRISPTGFPSAMSPAKLQSGDQLWVQRTGQNYDPTRPTPPPRRHSYAVINFSGASSVRVWTTAARSTPTSGHCHLAGFRERSTRHAGQSHRLSGFFESLTHANGSGNLDP